VTDHGPAIAASPDAGESHPRALKVGGLCLIVGGALWQPMRATEHLEHLASRSASWRWYGDQGGFLLAMLLLPTGLAGMDRARVANRRVIERFALPGLVAASVLLVVANAGDLLFRWSAADTMTGIGGC
jgi:hypothetical protein